MLFDSAGTSPPLAGNGHRMRPPDATNPGIQGGGVRMEWRIQVYSSEGVLSPNFCPLFVSPSDAFFDVLAHRRACLEACVT